MANALERANARKAAQKVSRPELLEELKLFPRPRLVAYVTRRQLSTNTEDWSDTQLLNAVNDLKKEDGKQKLSLTQEADMAATKGPKSYVLSYQTADPLQVKVVAYTKREAAAKAAEAIGEGYTAHVITEQGDISGINSKAAMAVVNMTVDTPITKFASKAAAAEQLFSSLDRAAMVSKGGKKKAAPGPRVVKPISYAPKAKGEIKQVREGTKIATLIDLLEKGATLADVEKALSATGKPVNARTWISYDLHSVVGYGAQEKDGVVTLVLPKGMTAPLAHTTKAASAPKAAKAAPAAAAEAPAKPAKAPKAKGGPKPGRETKGADTL